RRGGPASDAHREASRIGARRQPSCRSGFASHRTDSHLCSATPCAVGDVGPIIRLSRIGGLLRDYFFCAVVPKGHDGNLAYVGEFLEEAKASGLIKSFIERAGLRGMKVVPPAKSN